MTRILQDLRDRWTALSILNPTGASPSEIAALESRYGLHLPPLVREYFLELNGTATGQSGMEDDLISFWHIDQVRSVAEASPADRTPDAAALFLFADWSISAHNWAVRLTADSDAATPVTVCYDPGQKVAESFEAFLRGYLAKDERVLWPKIDPARCHAGRSTPRAGRPARSLGTLACHQSRIPFEHRTRSRIPPSHGAWEAEGR